MKRFSLFLISLLSFSNSSFAMLLVDVPADDDSQKKIIRLLKKNTFPNICIKNKAIHQKADQETITSLINYFSTFSNGSILQTPQSTFVARKLTEEGAMCSVIHIPQTIYDLEVIYRFLTDKDFAQKATDNTTMGHWNGVGIKDASIVDEQFLLLSKELFPIFRAYTTENEFINYAKERMQSILSIEECNHSSILPNIKEFFYLKKTRDLVMALISHELQDQKEGKISFYRGTNGVVYDEDRDVDEKVLSLHPKIMARYSDNVETLRAFFCGTGPSTMQSICGGKYPALPETSTIENIISFQRKTNVDNQFWQPILTDIANEVAPIGKIVDYPFKHDPNQDFDAQPTQPKELSYSYSPFGGFLFDGIIARQSACPFIYTIRDSIKYPYFYALSYTLPDFYKQYTSCFFAPQVPFYQGVFDSGEIFHPRLKNTGSGEFHNQLANFYGNIKILGLCGEDANTDQNKPFILALEKRHKKLIAQHTKRLINEKIPGFASKKQEIANLYRHIKKSGNTASDEEIIKYILEQNEYKNWDKLTSADKADIVARFCLHKKL